MSFYHILHFCSNFDQYAIVTFTILNWLFGDLVARIGKVYSVFNLLFVKFFIYLLHAWRGQQSRNLKHRPRSCSPAPSMNASSGLLPDACGHISAAEQEVRLVKHWGGLGGSGLESPGWPHAAPLECEGKWPVVATVVWWRCPVVWAWFLGLFSPGSEAWQGRMEADGCWRRTQKEELQEVEGWWRKWGLSVWRKWTAGP